jgi:phage baseplate assembly protein W
MKLTCDIDLTQAADDFGSTLGELVEQTIKEAVAMEIKQLVRDEIRGSKSVISSIRAEIVRVAKLKGELDLTASLSAD